MDSCGMTPLSHMAPNSPPIIAEQPVLAKRESPIVRIRSGQASHHLQQALPAWTPDPIRGAMRGCRKLTRRTVVRRKGNTSGCNPINLTQSRRYWAYFYS
jgi:hypothetical protein